MSTIRTKNVDKKGIIFKCEKCDYICSNKYHYNRHLSTAKHRIRTGLEQMPEKRSTECTTCNIVFQTTTELKRHMTTGKHNNVSKKGQPDSDSISITNTEVGIKYSCDCGNIYNSRSALWYHKKKCTHHIEPSNNSPPPENIVHESISDTTLLKCFQTMMETQMSAQTAAIEQAAVIQAKRDEATSEQTRLLVEAITLNGPQCITNNNTTNNNQFNLNVFLNEDCKDAYTLKEVMDSIECTVTDLDRMDHDGYVATITRKILESIQDMAITERPIHCTDARRNTVCVKDATGWEKNDKAMKMLANSVFLVGRKLGRMVDDWRVVYPDHFRGTVSRREQYHRLVTDIMRVNDLDVEARITSKVCKGVILDRKSIMDR